MSGPTEGLSPEAYATYGAPWDAELRADIASDLLRDGHVDLARQTVDGALAWNPGIDQLRRIQAIVRYEQGELDGPGLVATLEPGRSRFTSYLDIGLRLHQHGEDELAMEVLDDVQTQMSAYGNWGVNRTVIDVGLAQIAVAVDLGGCDAGDAQAAEVLALPAADAFVDTDRAVELALEEAGCP